MSREMIELAEKAKGIYSGYGSSVRYEKLQLCLDQIIALALLQKQPLEGELVGRLRNSAGVLEEGKYRITAVVKQNIIENCKQAAICIGRQVEANKSQAEEIERIEENIFEAARNAIGRYDPDASPMIKNRFANEFVEFLKDGTKKKSEVKDD